MVDFPAVSGRVGWGFVQVGNLRFSWCGVVACTRARVCSSLRLLPYTRPLQAVPSGYYYCWLRNTLYVFLHHVDHVVEHEHPRALRLPPPAAHELPLAALIGRAFAFLLHGLQLL